MNVLVPGRGNSKFIALSWDCLQNRKEARAPESPLLLSERRGSNRRRGEPCRARGKVGFCSPSSRVWLKHCSWLVGLPSQNSV